MDVNEVIAKHKNAVLSLAILAIAGFVSFNIYNKSVQEKAGLQAQIEDEKKKNEVLLQIATLEKKLEGYKQLLTKKEAGEVIGAISSYAKGFGLQIQSVRPGQEQKFKEYIKVPYMLVLRANSYHDIGRFVSMIESSREVFVIDAINIASETDIRKLIVNITVNAVEYTDTNSGVN